MQPTKILKPAKEPIFTKDKYENALIVEPTDELRFVGPFGQRVFTFIKLQNNSPLTLIFKIKTTAPDNYTVRPKLDKISPFGRAFVKVRLEPFSFEQLQNNNDKFLVQSFLTPQNPNVIDFNELWKDLKQYHLKNAKLRCVFEMPSYDAKTEDKNALDFEAGSSKAATEYSSDSQDCISSEDADSLIVRPQTEVRRLQRENVRINDQLLRLSEPPASQPLMPSNTRMGWEKECKRSGPCFKSHLDQWRRQRAAAVQASPKISHVLVASTGAISFFITLEKLIFVAQNMYYIVSYLNFEYKIKFL